LLPAGAKVAGWVYPPLGNRAFARRTSKWEPNSAGDPETQADNRARAIEFAKILKISTPAGHARLQDHQKL
jgi:hypothetical protein